MPYNPQQNWVAERKNRTICEATKAMLSDLDLPLSLWVEAAFTVVYIQKRSPHSILEERLKKKYLDARNPELTT